MDSKQIQEITTQGIIYINDEGNKQFIDFTECLNTYLKWELSAPVTTPRRVEAARMSKRVGEINYLGDIELSTTGTDDDSPPYVIFYDDQLTRFEFSDQDECAEFHQKMMDIGWRVFDLTD
ncbi:MAG: hypothetical protein ABI690_15105 [Chloroflexota bacterium]